MDTVLEGIGSVTSASGSNSNYTFETPTKNTGFFHYNINSFLCLVGGKYTVTLNEHLITGNILSRDLMIVIINPNVSPRIVTSVSSNERTTKLVEVINFDFHDNIFITLKVARTNPIVPFTSRVTLNFKK